MLFPLQDILLRLIQCNDTVFGSGELTIAATAAAEPPAFPAPPAEDDDADGDGIGVIAERTSWVFTTRNLETSYLAETLMCFVCIVSHLSPVHLDDLVLERLCNLVEQLIHRFPKMISASNGAR